MQRVAAYGVVGIYIEEADANNAPSLLDRGHEHVGCVKNMYFNFGLETNKHTWCVVMSCAWLEPL